MDLVKKKYTQNEVIEILKVYRREYEKELNEKQETISRLTEEINQLKQVVEQANAKKDIIASTLIRAEQTAADLKAKTELQYKFEVEKIKKFSACWNGYFNELKEKYPMYAPVKKALEFKGKIDKASNTANPKAVVAKLEASIPKEISNEDFNPKRKIRDYIAATGDNGFNLDEVLNPGELQLEDICKELGLLDGKE